MSYIPLSEIFWAIDVFVNLVFTAILANRWRKNRDALTGIFVVLQTLYVIIGIPTIITSFFSEPLPIQIFAVVLVIENGLRVAFVQYLAIRWLWTVPAPGMPRPLLAKITLSISTLLAAIISISFIAYAVFAVQDLRRGEVDLAIVAIIIIAIAQFILGLLLLINLIVLRVSLRRVTNPVLVWRRQKLSRIMILVLIQAISCILSFALSLIGTISWWVWLVLMFMPATLREPTEEEIRAIRVVNAPAPPTAPIHAPSLA